MKCLTLIISLIFTASSVSCSKDDKTTTSTTTSDTNTPVNISYSHSIIVPELSNPWAFTFLPDKSILITELSGELIHFKNNTKTKIQGLPTITQFGQGGLMDIELHPNYNTNGWIYITYASSEGGNGTNTALMRFKLNGNQATNKEVLYKATPNTSAGQHFGSRIAFDNDGYIYFTIGDRGQRDVFPQDVTKDGGKVYRLNDDGTIPNDNPFTTTSNAKKAVYSYGHRNPQGMVKHPKTGDIWTHEHGPRGGDEINIIKKGTNYGWPVITYGINYDGTPITDKTEMEGMEQPLHYWVPSIAPCGMLVVNSDKYTQLNDNLLIGSLKFQYLHRCILKDNKVIKEERLLKDIGRVRCIEQGPDGYVYVGVQGLGIVKLIEEKQ